jgi:hypothetical protein
MGKRPAAASAFSLEAAPGNGGRFGRRLGRQFQVSKKSLTDIYLENIMFDASNILKELTHE